MDVWHIGTLQRPYDVFFAYKIGAFSPVFFVYTIPIASFLSSNWKIRRVNLAVAVTAKFD